MADDFKKTYTPLSEEQQKQMIYVKDKAQELMDLLNTISDPAVRSEKGRCMSVARTDLQTAIMWAVRAVTE